MILNPTCCFVEDQYPRWARHMEGPPGPPGLAGPRTAGVTPAGGSTT